jgi:hypothetical protein
MRCAALMLTFCLTISGIFVGSGCASTPPPKPARAALTPPRVVGEIAIVDKEKHFVLVDLESNLYVPPPGTELQSRNGAGKIAHLKASPEQKRPFIAADIVDGEPAVGDQVIR